MKDTTIGHIYRSKGFPSLLLEIVKSTTGNGIGIKCVAVDSEDSRLSGWRIGDTNQDTGLWSEVHWELYNIKSRNLKSLYEKLTS